MKLRSASVTASFLAISALALLGPAHAESYEGVHAAVGQASRGAIQAEAVGAARAPDQNVVRGSRGPETVAASRNRAQVVAEAERAAAAPDQNVSSGSRVNSRVISTLPNPVDTRAAGRAAAGSRL